MYSPQIEELMEAIIADGQIDVIEAQVLYKRAAAEGIDINELNIILNARLTQRRKQIAQQEQAAQPEEIAAEAVEVVGGVEVAEVVEVVETEGQNIVPMHGIMQQPAPQKRPRTEHYGNVLTCPNCGAHVVGGTAVCHDCGHVFTNVSRMTPQRELSMRLEQINKSQGGTTAKMDLISNFPVPNTRADLLDMLTSIESKIDAGGPIHGEADYGEDLGYAYWALFSNCIGKAKLSFLNDPDFAPFYIKHDEELARTKGLSGFMMNRKRNKVNKKKKEEKEKQEQKEQEMKLKTAEIYAHAQHATENSGCLAVGGGLFLGFLKWILELVKFTTKTAIFIVVITFIAALIIIVAAAR